MVCITVRACVLTCGLHHGACALTCGIRHGACDLMCGVRYGACALMCGVRFDACTLMFGVRLDVWCAPWCMRPDVWFALRCVHLEWSSVQYNCVCMCTVEESLMKALADGERGFSYLSPVLVVLLQTLLQDEIMAVSSVWLCLTPPVVML